MFSKDQEGDLWEMIPALHREVAALHDGLLAAQLALDQANAKLDNLSAHVAAIVLAHAETNKHLSHMGRNMQRLSKRLHFARKRSGGDGQNPTLP